MNNKAVRDAIKKGCRIFPEFDMQGFRLICKICNIPMEISENTRLIDLEAHTKSASHLASMSSNRSTRSAKCQRNNLSLSQSSLDKSLDKSINSSGSRIVTTGDSPSISRQPVSSTPSTTPGKRAKRVAHPRGKVYRPDLYIPKILLQSSSSSSSASSASSSSSSSYATSCSTTLVATPKINKTNNSETSKTKKSTDNLTPKTRDKLIILSDDTQDSVYLSGPDDEFIGDKSSSLSTNTNKSFKANPITGSNVTRITSTPNDPTVPSSSTLPQTDPATDSIEKPSESSNGQQQPVNLTINNNKQPDKSEPHVEPKADPKDDLKPDASADSKVLTLVVNVSYNSEQNNFDPKNQVNVEESTLNGQSELTPSIRPGDSLLVSSSNIAPPQLAITYPVTVTETNQLISSNASEMSGNIDKPMETTDNSLKNQPETVSSELLDNSGARSFRQRKRKQILVKDEPVTPIKSVKSNGYNESVGTLDCDSMTKVKSARKGRKRKTMRISDFVLLSPDSNNDITPLPTTSTAATTPTPTNNSVNPLEASNSSIELTEMPNYSDSAPSSSSNTTNNFNSSTVTKSDQILQSSSSEAIVKSSLTTEDNTGNKSNGLGNENNQLNGNITINGNTTATTTAITTVNNMTATTSINNSTSETNGQNVKLERDEIYCTYENVQFTSTIKTEPTTTLNDDFQPNNMALYADLIDLCLGANLSFNKLTGPLCRSFFQKHFTVSIPSAVKLETHVLKPIQQSKMDKLKQLVANHNIYLIVKIHLNEARGHILTIMVGVLNGEPARSHLYKLSILPEVDLTILSRQILNTLHNLYQGFAYEKLSLLITDDSPLMGQIGNFLKTLHPKLRHVPCFYQVYDNICEQFRKKHPLMKLYVNTVNSFFFSSPKFVIKYKQSSTKSREVPIPSAKLHGYNWMLVAGDFFDETNLIAQTISQSCDPSTQDSFLAKVHRQLDNKDLQMEWIDFNGYHSVHAAIELLKSSTLSITQMKKINETLGRYPKRSAILTRISDTIKSNPDLGELMKVAGDIDEGKNDSNDEIFNYAPLSTIDSFNCYDTFLAILEENGGSIADSQLETLTFLASNKDL